MKIGLVLEGGGMRGAYTAGALAWLVDQGIEVDYGVGISSGAVHLCSYFLKNKKFLYDMSVKVIPDKKNVGLYPLLHERRYVGYDHMFDDLLPNDLKYSVTSLRENQAKLEFGLYDMTQCNTRFFDSSYLDDDLRYLKASCTLPIAGRIVTIDNVPYLDGGIEIMIPIERSFDVGCDRNLIITTKPEGYVRKAASNFMVNLMKMNYPKYPKLVEHYANRHLSYNRQMEIIEEGCKNNTCYLVRPSETIDVKRFSGDSENLAKLYDLGYADMENNKEDILLFLNKK